MGIAIFLVFYARRRALSRKGFASSLHKLADEWEVNSGDMTLLEKLGDGFFGVVHRAYLYHRSAGNSSRLAQKDRNSFSNRSEVACKMLKGASRLCFLSTSICSLFELALISSANFHVRRIECGGDGVFGRNRAHEKHRAAPTHCQLCGMYNSINAVLPYSRILREGRLAQLS